MVAISIFTMLLPLSLRFYTLLLFISCQLFVTNASFVLQVAVEDEECLVFRAAPNSLVSGNFDVLDDNLSPNPVRVKLLRLEQSTKKLELLYESEEGISEDIFRIPTKQGGRLYVCVQNGMDSDSEDELDRNVGLDVRVSPLPKEENGSAQELIEIALQLRDRMWDLENHLDYMRNREAIHREVTEQTFTHVVRWSIMEFVVLLGIAIAQVLALRRFFERKRYI